MSTASTYGLLIKALIEALIEALIKALTEALNITPAGRSQA
ncbi:MAG: hypothetical protein WA783_01020 [Phormidesmis sp.]